MDPATLGLISTGAGLLKNLFGGGSSKPAAAPAGPQRADGYAIGGMLESDSQNWMSSGATGGAYGGAYNQSNFDGSNWTVATGGSKAIGGGTSGGNGGMSPVQTVSQGGVNPVAPFSFAGAPLATNGGSTMTLVLLAAVAYLALRKG